MSSKEPTKPGVIVVFFRHLSNWPQDLLVPSLLQSDLAPDLAQQVEDPPKEGPVLRALVTDVLPRGDGIRFARARLNA